jgi:hypothetical protein
MLCLPSGVHYLTVGAVAILLDAGIPDMSLADPCDPEFEVLTRMTSLDLRAANHHWACTHQLDELQTAWGGKFRGHIPSYHGQSGGEPVRASDLGPRQLQRRFCGKS